MKKILLRAGIGLVVLIVIAALGVHFFLDGAVKRGVETKGPELTKVDVKLDSVNLSLFSGSGKIKGFLLGNPTGFKSPQAIVVSNVSVGLKPGSVFSDKLIITSINVESPEVTLEIGLGGNNLGKILDNLNAATAGTEPTEKEKEKKEGRKMQVDDFRITGARVHGGLTGVAEGSVTIPEIHLTGLGTGPEGITAAELSKKVLAALEEKAVAALGTGLNNLGKGTLDVKSLTGTNNAAEKVTKGLNDLLKKK
jgi:hypothetical protein